MSHPRFSIFLSGVNMVRSLVDGLRGSLATLANDYKTIPVTNASTDEGVAILRQPTAFEGVPNLQLFTLTQDEDVDTAARSGAGKLAILGTKGIPARYGGFETFAEKLSLGLVERGFDVTVYCETTDEMPARLGGVKLEYVPLPKLGPLSTVVFDLRCLWHARRDHEVVYMLGYGAAMFCFIPRLWGKQVWLNMDGLEWKRSKWSKPAKIWLKMMEAIAMWTPNRIIADAAGIKDSLQSRHARLPPVSVIPYGAPVIESGPDHGVLAEMNLAPFEYYLVVCRLEPENHVLEILRGYALSDTTRPLIVVGNHLSGTPYVAKLRDINIPSIRFVGAIYDQKKLLALRYYCAAYFHGHSVGGTNPSLLEAMGCGNLVIAHDNMFNREVLGEMGMYFRSEMDIPALSNAVENCDISTRNMVSSDSVARIRAFYTWDMIVEKYTKLLTETIQKK
ncbi:MAG TPA: DUF1972 domain-containing protein [Gallionella sp.]|nr:DUF1972 domain-containing protein [Gallionella sp.]